MRISEREATSANRVGNVIVIAGFDKAKREGLPAITNDTNCAGFKTRSYPINNQFVYFCALKHSKVMFSSSYCLYNRVAC
jgi:hypothetical protein